MHGARGTLGSGLRVGDAASIVEPAGHLAGDVERASEICPVKPSIVELGTGESRLSKVSMTEVRVGKYRAIQRGPKKTASGALACLREVFVRSAV